jgi:hypothetical protein
MKNKSKIFSHFQTFTNDKHEAVPLLKFINSYATWFGRKRTTYIGIVSGQSIGKEVTTEFTLLGFLNMQVNKRGGLFKECW